MFQVVGVIVLGILAGAFEWQPGRAERIDRERGEAEAEHCAAIFDNHAPDTGIDAFRGLG